MGENHPYRNEETPLRPLLMAIVASLLGLTAPLGHAAPVHGIAMHGDPALPADYKHFSYVNPDVKKGGRIAYGVVGTFDSLNPFILKSMRTTARGMWDPEFGNLVYESLMVRSRDEAFTMYGLLAESVEWDDDRSFIEFHINPKARWADGQPVTPEDVIFTFELMRDKGRAPFSIRLNTVEKLEKTGEHSVRFTFNDKGDREAPLLIAFSPILPKHAIDVETFDRSSLALPLGSGPYKVKAVKPGERIVYERDPNYWGKDIPSKVGFDNYDEISVEYFLQDNTLFEAFKKGVIDVYQEGNPTKWARGYDFPAVQSGTVIKDAVTSKLPPVMFGFVFNTRRPVFQNAELRKALSLAFDFEWVNRTLFENAYTRTESFWQNSELSSLNVPIDAREREIIGEAANRIDPAVLAGTYRLPVTDGSGRDRAVLRQAMDHFKKAGYSIQNGRMVGPSGEPLAFEIMTQNADQEKLALAYQRFLAALGVRVSLRTVDDSQYQSRSQTFDYDVIMKAFLSSLSPGLEQVRRWGTDARDREGSENFAGVADPDLDRVMTAILSARSAEDFRSAVRLQDRMLLSGNYIVPLYHLSEQWIARNKRIGRPQMTPLWGFQLPAWWDEKAQ
jgi:peptide/nickel transport system substrate-binding protein